MANHFSALKRARQTEIRTERNRDRLTMARARRLRILIGASLVAGTLAVPAARAVAPADHGPVVATVDGTSAVLGDSRVRRE